MVDDKTIKFLITNDKYVNIKSVLASVYDSLSEKGYSAVDQIAGYILTEDPTYITTYQNARSKIQKIDRDELLRLLIKNYINR